MPTENTKILAGVNLLRKAHAAGLLTDRDVYDVLKSSKRLQQQSFVSIDVLDECIRSIIEDKKRPDFGGPANSIVEVERLVGAKANAGESENS